MKRILVLILCALYVFMAGTASAAELPKDMFITKDELMQLCQETNAGKGLLTTGTNSDVLLRINFGQRPSDDKYYRYVPDESNVMSVAAGPITWLLAGADECGLVLYSEEPLLGCERLNPDRTTVFAHDLTNSWQNSILRDTLKGLVAENSSFFSAAERNLMAVSRVSTWSEPEPYETDDVLYAPAIKTTDRIFTVGSNDEFAIHNNYWRSAFWLRSPYEDLPNTALAVNGSSVNIVTVTDTHHSISGAFALKADDLLFASAANGATAAEAKHAIQPGTPMTLRIAAPHSFGEVLISNNGAKLKASSEYGARLMIQGKDWFYSKPVMGSVTLSAGDIFPTLTSLLDCKVWLETDLPSGGTLTYAQPATISNVFEGETGSEGEVSGENPLPETGDGANLALWLAMLAVSTIGILNLSRKARKEN